MTITDRDRLAAILDRHLTDRDYDQGCTRACGYDGDDRDEHLADVLLASGVTLPRQGVHRGWPADDGGDPVTTTDRERLLTHLAAARWGDAYTCYPQDDPRARSMRADVKWIADALHAQHAVVELPEGELDDDGQIWFDDYAIRVDRTGLDVERSAYVDGLRWTASAMRNRAAALLAAANYLEEGIL